MTNSRPTGGTAQNPLPGTMLRQKPHVRFLEAFPVRAVGRCSRPPAPISGIVRIGAELRPHGGERRTGSASGSVGRSPMIRDGRSEEAVSKLLQKSAQRPIVSDERLSR